MLSICMFAKDMPQAMSQNEFSGNELKMKLRSSDQYITVPVTVMNFITNVTVCEWESAIDFIYFLG